MSGFSMIVADPTQLRAEEEQKTQVLTEEETLLQAQARQNAIALMNCDLDSLAERRSFATSIEQFGAETMRGSDKKNNLLRTTVGKMAETGGESGEIAKGLMALHKEVKALDPSLINFSKGGLFGKVSNSVKDYFRKYEKSENLIADIVVSLDRGKMELKNDNTTLQIEEQRLREITIRLNKEIALGQAMDAALEQEIEKAQMEGVDPAKIRFAQEEILFPLRQRIMDMQQKITVNTQGVIAMEIVRRNNLELIRGVDRVKFVTLDALETAVMVAQALFNQKIVLQKVQAIQEVTNNTIAATSRMLKEQGSDIQQQAMETGVSLDTMRSAFNDLFAAVDEISNYKQNALPVMKRTIEEFSKLAARGEEKMQQLEKGSALASLKEGS